MNDLNVALLKKNLIVIKNGDESSWLPNNYQHWLALGHYDDIFTYEIDKSASSFLLKMKSDKEKVLKHNDEDFYYNPIYLIPDSYISENTSKNRWFIAVVRIHFSESVKLKTQFDDLGQEIKKQFDNSNIFYQIYHATELSDMVLDIRCDNLKQLIDAVFEIRKAKANYIGKMYTYFGINYSFLELEPFAFDETDVVDLISVRFSGYNMDITKKQIELIKKHLDNSDNNGEYLINGIDDIMLVFNRCKTSDIIELYKEWLFDDKNENYKKSESLTRLGLKMDIEGVNSLGTSKDMTDMCGDLPKFCERVSELIEGRSDKDKVYFGWIRTILEISNVLVRMSKNPVMDEVVYLIAPAIKAFLLNVIEMLELGIVNKGYFGFLYNFTENCAYYLEQLTRIEGQLSHNPEIRPTIYDIPVFMLEYTLVFLNKVSDLLRHTDEKGLKQETYFLLVPRPCERVKALEIFPATIECPGLVYIEIPERLLYHPNEIFRALCHELAHYIGETFRKREIRKECYLNSVAILLAYSVFDNDIDEEFRNMLVRELKENIDNDGKLTISAMHDQAMDALTKVFGPVNYMDNILRKYFDSLLKDNALPKYIDLLTDEQIKLTIKEYFLPKLNDMDILYREVFADICMLHILKLETQEYINSLMDEVATYPNGTKKIYYELFAIRIYIVLKVFNRQSDSKMDNRKEWEEVYSRIEEIGREIDSGFCNRAQFYMPINATSVLLEYAEKCYNDINSELTNSKILDVQQIYKAISSGHFEFENILAEIDKYRIVYNEKHNKNVSCELK